MEKDRKQHAKTSRTLQPKSAAPGSVNIVDNRHLSLSGSSLQRVEDEEEEVVQGKMEHAVQRIEDEEEEVAQRKADSQSAGRAGNMSGNVVQMLNPNMSTRDFRENHLIKLNGRSYRGNYSPAQVLRYRAAVEGDRFQGTNSMMTVGDFLDIPVNHPQEMIVRAKTWNGVFNGSGLRRIEKYGPVNVRLCFNSYGHASHIDELTGRVRQRKKK